VGPAFLRSGFEIEQILSVVRLMIVEPARPHDLVATCAKLTLEGFRISDTREQKNLLVPEPRYRANQILAIRNQVMLHVAALVNRDVRRVVAKRCLDFIDGAWQ